MNNILRGEGTQVDQLTITLLWNADDDLDLSFVCDDTVEVNWNYRDVENQCQGIYDVE